MPIRFSLKDGRPDSIEMDTVDEAVKFYRQLNGHAQPVGATEQPRVKRVADAPIAAMVGPEVQRARRKPDEVNERVRGLILEMAKHPRGSSGKVLAEAIKTDSHGLGSVVAATYRYAASLGLQKKKDVVVKDRQRVDGQLVRTLRLGEGLARRVREGLLDA